MKEYIHRYQVNAPLKAVSDFHFDTKSLKYLNPPPFIVQLHQAEPMGEGSITDFTLWMGLIPIHWRAVHSDVNPLQGFTDTQVEGPFKNWVHQHRFNQLDEASTEVIDLIQAQPREDFLMGLVGRLIWIGLPLLFAYRSWKTKKILKNEL